MLGYYSAVGWDPVTGFGSIDFTKFYAFYTTLQPTDTQPPSTNGAIGRLDGGLNVAYAMCLSSMLAMVFALVAPC